MRDSFFKSHRAGEMPRSLRMVDEAVRKVNKKSILWFVIDYLGQALQYAA
ncbi:hypothetical protein [Bordetella sp. BOR01]|nr:hypothetical protein [Bordetella sp. BOR01]MBV7486604.1 hypothetical protein [Bordetella sp. BOR01]